MLTKCDLPEEYLQEAIRLTHVNTKTDVIKMAFEKLIQ